MKKLITALFLTISCSLFAQSIVNITYVTVPRENSETFLELHEKFTNLSLGEERKLEQSAMFSHAFAGDFTFAIYDFYGSEVALVSDAEIANTIMAANIKAMNLDEKGKAAMNADYQSYISMYVEGHSDQIRTSKGLEALKFENESIDWSVKKVVVLSKYNTKWAKNNDFREALVDVNLNVLKESGKVEAVYTSRHLYGAGMDWHMYMFYNSWSDFAAYEESNFGGSMDASGMKFWSAINGHEDEILMWIGAINPQTKRFYYAK
ncbi:MAG: hypothetical protein ACI6PN_07535 [Polaribacter sp.]|uniref:hypothetical protein n=1 Tax=Polaribacter sp. TaxID=1920175 RepID=UPI00384A47CA